MDISRKNFSIFVQMKRSSKLRTKRISFTVTRFVSSISGFHRTNISVSSLYARFSQNLCNFDTYLEIFSLIFAKQAPWGGRKKAARN